MYPLESHRYYEKDTLKVVAFCGSVCSEITPLHYEKRCPEFSDSFKLKENTTLKVLQL